MNAVRRSAAILLVAMLGGCVGERPPIPHAASFTPPSQWRESTFVVAPIDKQWWASFHDPELTTLVERALERNDSIAEAVTRVQQARALAQVVKSEEAPQVTAAGSMSDSQTVFFGRPLDAAVGVPQIEISYDLDLFGRLAQASASARASLLASEASRDAVRLAIASTAATGYINLLSLDARLVTTKATLAARAEALSFAQRRAATGYTSRLELKQAEAEYVAAKQMVPAAELAITTQENALCVLLGDTPHKITRSKTLDDLQTPVVPDGLPSSLLRRRPDIVAAEAAVVAQDRSLDSARAAMLPTIALTGSGGVAYATVDAINPITLFSIGGSILYPVFDGRRLRSESEAVAARRDQAAFEYRSTALTAFREVEDGLASIHRIDEQEQAADEQVTVLREALRIATNRYRGGYSPYLDQIDAERGLLAAQLNSIQLRSEWLVSYVTVFRAMGGGWDESQLAELSPKATSRKAVD